MLLEKVKEMKACSSKYEAMLCEPKPEIKPILKDYSGVTDSAQQFEAAVKVLDVINNNL